MKMTTPERLRRRQYLLGIFVLCLSVFSVAEGVYFRILDKEQRDCLQSSFADLSRSLDHRGDLNQRDSDSINRIIVDVFNAKTADEARTAFRKYEATRRQINAERRAHPIPPFPAGTCD